MTIPLDRLTYRFHIAAFVILLPVFGGNIRAQDEKQFRNLFRQAESHTIAEEYQQAILVYNDLIKIEPNNRNLQFLVGYCHMNARNPIDSAIRHLEKASLDVDVNYAEGSYQEQSSPPLVYFLLGKTYQRGYQFDMAVEAFNTYNGYLDKWAVTELEYVKRSISSCELAKLMVNNPRPVDWVLQDFPKATNESVTNPVISGNETVMVYKANRPAGSKIIMARRFNNSWSEINMIERDLEVSEFAYPSSLSHDGNELYIVEPYQGGGDIYISKFDGDKWSPAAPVGKPINSKGPETHASISSDNSTLFFTSIRKDGWGGIDIYKSVKDEDGEWTDPINLGFGVNTYYNEATPFISQHDSILYFSSEGLETMGGFDIFSSNIDDEGGFSEARNMGYPVSTPDDDLFYNPGWYDTKSYFARISNDNNGTRTIYSIVTGELPEFLTAVPEEDVTTVLTINELPVNEEADSSLLTVTEIIGDSINQQFIDRSDTLLAEISEENLKDSAELSLEETSMDNMEEIAKVIETDTISSELSSNKQETIQRREDIPWPTGYSVQIIALKKPKEVSYFKGLGKVTMYPGKDGFYRYVIGQYNTIPEAMVLMDRLRKNGHPNAFIRSYKYLYKFRRESHD